MNPEKSNVQISGMINPDLLPDIYHILKEKQDHSHQDDEIDSWLQKVEQSFMTKEEYEQKQRESVIQQAYQILESTDTWALEDKELYGVLEKVVFLKGRSGELIDYFDEINEVVLSVISADYTRLAPEIGKEDDKRNILNFYSVALNTIIERLQTHTVTKKACDAITSIGDKFIIVTDFDYNIKYISSKGEAISGYSLKELRNVGLCQIIEGFESFESAIDRNDEKDITIKFKNSHEVTGQLIIPEIDNFKEQEVDELVICISCQNNQHKDLEVPEMIKNVMSPLNTIKGISTLLERKQNEMKEVISLLNAISEESMSNMKAQLHDYYESEVEQHIDFYQVIKIIEQTFSREIAKGQLSILSEVGEFEYKGKVSDFISILQNLIYNALKHKKNNERVIVEVSVYLDNDLNIVIKNNNEFLEQEERYNILESLLRNTLNELKGTIEVERLKCRGVSYHLKLPR